MINEVGIVSFTGPYRFLSNFYEAPVVFGGQTYPTAEHAYQAAKCGDEFEFASILHAKTPAIAKKLGSICEVVSNWDDIKLSIMERIVRAKFTQNIDLMKKLLDTKGRKLVEGNYWKDRFWGECPLGTGQNHLGKILMKIRDEVDYDYTLDNFKMTVPLSDFSISDPQPNYFMISGDKGEMVRIDMKNGDITLSNNYTFTDAAKQFWQCISSEYRDFIQKKSLTT